MKKIYVLSVLVFALQFVNLQIGFSQAPVLTAIQGQSIVCSTANSASGNYSVTASNNPTSYLWTVMSSDGSATFGNPNAASTSVSFSTFSSFGSFTLICTAQNGSGFGVPVMIVVKVFETPSVTFSGASNLCQGGSGGVSASSISSTLFQSSSTTIFWAPAIGLSSTNSPSVIANPPVTTNYTILTSFGPCTATNYFLVTVINPPVVNPVLSPTSICSGQSSTLTVTGTATSYSVNGVPISGPLIYSPTSNTTYVVAGASAGPCPGVSSTVNLAVNPIPLVNASFSPSVICVGEKSTLHLTGTAQTYSVNGVLASASSSYSPSAGISLTVNGTGTGSCQSLSSAIALVVNPCTGLNAYREKASILSIYPNPNNGIFILKSETDKTVAIINELGQYVTTLILKANSETKLSGLSAGIYFVVSETEKKKIVVTP